MRHEIKRRRESKWKQWTQRRLHKQSRVEYMVVNEIILQESVISTNTTYRHANMAPTHQHPRTAAAMAKVISAPDLNDVYQWTILLSVMSNKQIPFRAVPRCRTAALPKTY